MLHIPTLWDFIKSNLQGYPTVLHSIKHIAIKPEVRSYNIWANIYCLGCSLLGEISLWHRTVLTYCLLPSHYQNQCWLIVNWTFGNKLRWNSNWKFNHLLHSRKCIWKCCLQNGGHFVSMLMMSPGYMVPGHLQPCYWPNKHNIPRSASQGKKSWELDQMNQF